MNAAGRLSSLCRQPFLLLLLLFVSLVGAWDHDQLEIFDIVEEVNENFYELLRVGENAETSEIRKAYRKRSLELHPDVNPAEDAEVQFRQVCSFVYLFILSSIHSLIHLCIR